MNLERFRECGWNFFDTPFEGCQSWKFATGGGGGCQSRRLPTMGVPKSQNTNCVWGWHTRFFSRYLSEFILFPPKIDIWLYNYWYHSGPWNNIMVRINSARNSIVIRAKVNFGKRAGNTPPPSRQKLPKRGTPNSRETFPQKIVFGI